MKYATITALLVLLCGCNSEKKQFYTKMSRYEAQCDQYYSVYCSGNVEDAKKALHDIIDLSQAEKSKAKFYWNFDTVTAFAEARLAVIAEKQGQEDEAKRLFAIASDNMVSGDEAFRQEARKEGDIDMRSFDANPVQRMTPEEWRKGIAALDKVNHVKWKSPNKSLQPLEQSGRLRKEHGSVV